MGNCTSGMKKKNKGDAAQDDKPNEEVTYASIDHITAKASKTNHPRPTKVMADDDDCDYAIVHIPAAPSDSDSSKDECADDYVLMG